MPVVTLTTDWGTRDHYLASFKGRLLGAIPEVQLIDISHAIQPFNILEASFILKNAYSNFPKGTVHYVGMTGKSQNVSPVKMLIVVCEEHFFIGADTGIFSLVLEEKEKKIYSISSYGEELNPWNNKMVDNLAQLAINKNPGQLGILQPDLVTYFQSQPIFDSNSIRGTIIYIDEFENLVLNVTKDLFYRVANNRAFAIDIIRSNQRISRLSTLYNDVEEGELLARFNQDGYLEIALNQSNAAGLLGLKQSDTIRIEFQ